VKTFLKSNPDIAQDIETQLRKSYGLPVESQKDESSTPVRPDPKKPAGTRG